MHFNIKLPWPKLHTDLGTPSFPVPLDEMWKNPPCSEMPVNNDKHLKTHCCHFGGHYFGRSLSLKDVYTSVYPNVFTLEKLRQWALATYWEGKCLQFHSEVAWGELGRAYQPHVLSDKVWSLLISPIVQTYLFTGKLWLWDYMSIPSLMVL